MAIKLGELPFQWSLPSSMTTCWNSAISHAFASAFRALPPFRLTVRPATVFSSTAGTTFLLNKNSVDGYSYSLDNHNLNVSNNGYKKPPSLAHSLSAFPCQQLTLSFDLAIDFGSPPTINFHHRPPFNNN
ncbi:hypothetical protein KEM48_002711 [Puccinia striiformis f. sp. tritici PST-130]|nr:hypothetical protein KEM48_002711 [Puccinia striiformis f. sp. tritici PST-130]